MTERLHFHFSVSCIGEGNGNPLQCSCLENPRDGGAWWAAVYRVAQSRTRLKRLSSSTEIQSALFLLRIQHVHWIQNSKSCEPMGSHYSRNICRCYGATEEETQGGSLNQPECQKRKLAKSHKLLPKEKGI